jgi:transcriptional regulator with XRE-family HTH domain
MNSHLQELGEELKQARERSELTLQQISSKIRIDPKFVEKMEAGEFDFLPDIYVAAFVKELARLYELNEELFVKRYKAAKAGKALDQLEKEEAEREKAERERAEEKGEEEEKKVVGDDSDFDDQDFYRSRAKQAARNRMMIIGGLVAVVAFIVVYYVFIKPDDDVIVKEPSIEEIVEDRRERYRAEGDGASISDTMTLALDVRERSWVEVIEDDGRPIDLTFDRNFTYEYKALRKFRLTTNNAPGVRLTLDGEPIDLPVNTRGNAAFVIDRDGVERVDVE